MLSLIPDFSQKRATRIPLTVLKISIGPSKAKVPFPIYKLVRKIWITALTEEPATEIP